MRYRIDPSADFALEIRRIAAEQMAAVDEIRSVDAAERESAVHAARRHCKKARAALRLAAPLFDEDQLKACTTPIRDAGRALSHERNAAVLVRALNVLRETYRDRTESEFVDQIQTELETSRNNAIERGARADPAQVARNVDAALEQLGRWQPGIADPSEIIEGSLTRAYRNCIRAFRLTNPAADEADAWHRSRQAVKDLWYQTRLLTPGWPPVMRGLATAVV